MKITKKHRNHLKSRVRNMLVLNSRVTAREIAEMLSISPFLANALKKEIHTQDTDYENTNIQLRVAQTERELDAYKRKLQTLVFPPKPKKDKDGNEIAPVKTSHRDVISAIRQLNSNTKLRWDILFDSGIYRRELGNQLVQQEESKNISANDFLNYLLNNAPNEKIKNAIIKLTDQFLTSGNEEELPKDPVEKQSSNVQP